MSTRKKFPKMRPSGPHNLDEHSWWYREADGAVTFVHEDTDEAGRFVRVQSWKIGARVTKL